MVKVIMGLKGEGKTKKLIDHVKAELDKDRGDVVVIEKDAVLTYDIPHKARLVKLSDYKDSGAGYDLLRGFICGLRAGNYDIIHIFMDSITKLSGNKSLEDAEAFLNWCEAFSAREGVDFTVTLSADSSQATDGIKKYF